MNTLFRYFSTFGLIITSLLILTGCRDELTLRPEDTVVGSKKHNHPNWVDETQLYAKEGLSFREDFQLDEKDTAAITGNSATDETEKLQVIAQVYFNYDNSSIQPTERAKLQDAMKLLAKNPNKRFLLTGHCDWHGTQEYNMALGDRRANSVNKYLAQLGAGTGQIKTRSRGSLDAVKGAPDEQASQDRRADLIMIK